MIKHHQPINIILVSSGYKIRVQKSNTSDFENLISYTFPGVNILAILFPILVKVYINVCTDSGTMLNPVWENKEVCRSTGRTSSFKLLPAMPLPSRNFYF